MIQQTLIKTVSLYFADKKKTWKLNWKTETSDVDKFLS